MSLDRNPHSSDAPSSRRATSGARRTWLSALPLLVACGTGACSPEPPQLETRFRLLDPDTREAAAPDTSGILAAYGAPPAIARIEHKGEERPTLILRCPARVRFRSPAPEGGRLQFGLAVRPPEAPVQLRLSRRREGRLDTLYAETWRLNRRWVEREVALEASESPADLELSIDGPAATVWVAQPTLLAPVRARDQQRPNVILYVVDCLRADHVGAYGYSRPTTPQLDHLARDGIVFERAYACAGWTKPSIGCLMSSRYPISHGARTVDDGINRGTPMLAQAFQAGGYSTLAWVANPMLAGAAGFSAGFDRFVQLASGFEKRSVNVVEADAAEITQAMTHWLQRNPHQRFFAYLHSLDLHREYRPRPPFDRMFVRSDVDAATREMDLYDNEIAYNDREIGRLASELQRLGLYDDTLIAVTADHGEEFGEHGSFRHGHTLYDTLLHVPMILKLPRTQPRRARVDVLASELDIGPTLLDYAGLPPVDGAQGVSLRSSIASGAPVPRRLLFAEQLSPTETLYAVRDDRLKYVVQLLPGPAEHLFDTRADPRETRDLLPAAAGQAATLTRELHEYIQLGQYGYQLGVEYPDAEALIRVEARTEDRFEDPERLVVRTGDRLRLGPDARRLSYSFASRGEKHHLIFRTRPPGAPVRLTVWVGGRTLSPELVGLGAEGHAPRRMPFSVDGNAVTADAAQSARLMSAGDRPVRLWYVPAPANRRADRPQGERLEQLKALGYVQ